MYTYIQLYSSIGIEQVFLTLNRTWNHYKNYKKYKDNFF
jgi:hypothetical protein